MSSAFEGLRFECEQCGYELTGLAPPGRERADVTCPECGETYGWPPPLKREPWPAWWSIALRLSGASIGYLILFGTGVTFIPDSSWACLGGPLLVVIWFMLAVALPGAAAYDLAARHELRPRRPKTTRRLAWAGIIVNLVLTTAGLIVIGNLVR